MVFYNFNRHQVIRKIQADLLKNSFPRMQMFLLVLLTGVSGFITSYTLLHAGLFEMWLRYLASFGVAYLMFLLMLWVWLKTKANDYIDIPDSSGLQSSTSCGSGSGYSGKGGDFGGGGSSGSFDAQSEKSSIIGDSGIPVGDALSTAAEAEEFAIPLFLLIIIVVMLLSSFFIIYSAPVLFAELLVDGVLSASLYRSLRGLEKRHWLETAFRRTALPFALTAVIVSVCGFGLQLYVPNAHSIGEVMSLIKLGRF